MAIARTIARVSFPSPQIITTLGAFMNYHCNNLFISIQDRRLQHVLLPGSSLTSLTFLTDPRVMN